MIIRKINITPLNISNSDLGSSVRFRLRNYLLNYKYFPNKEILNIDKYIKTNYSNKLNINNLFSILTNNINVIKGEDKYYIELSEIFLTADNSFSTLTLYKLLKYGSFGLRKTNLFEKALDYALLRL